MPVLTVNKKARHDYDILETLEVGIQLEGQEVKSVRAGRMGLLGSYVTIRQGQAWLLNAHVPKYPQAGPLPGYDPYRTRRLLLHRREVARLMGRLETKGLTLVPLSVYTKRSLIKLEIGLGRGKTQYEKRDSIKKRDLDREVRRALKL